MNNEFQILINSNVAELVNKRTSVRTYSNEKVSEDILDNILNFSNNINGPFSGINIRYEIVDKNNFLDSKKMLGTYGVISGATKFLVPIVDRCNYNFEQLGYCFECILLYITSIGMGSCWLGGTFSRKSFAYAVNLKDNEMIPAISPIGYASPKKSLIEKIVNKSKKRNDSEKMFFNENTSSPLTKSLMGPFSLAFELTQLAPSSMNSQPWRIIKEGSDYHFFKCKDSKKELDMQRIDMGIALCHFELGCSCLDLHGTWILNKSKLFFGIPDKYQYLITWSSS